MKQYYFIYPILHIYYIYIYNIWNMSCLEKNSVKTTFLVQEKYGKKYNFNVIKICCIFNNQQAS